MIATARIKLEKLANEHALQVFSVTLISFMFLLLYSLMVRSLTGLSISSFLPGPSDMSAYYIKINAAVNHGVFSSNAGMSGYLLHGNVLYVSDWLFYGAHGMFILLPYIFLGNILGWAGATPLVIHVILLTVSFYFVYFCTSSLKMAVVVQLLTFSFTPLLLYFSTAMMEIQMYAWGIIIVSLLYRLHSTQVSQSVI